MESTKRIESWFRGAFKPEPRLTVSQWADAHRILSKKSSAEPGRWSTDRTPYLREIMDCLSVTHPCERVVFKKASQVGGTECLNNWIGYIIDHAPAPVMLVQPTIELARRNSRLRIEPLIEECPRLKNSVSPAKSREASNTMLQKDFDGGTLVMTGANTASGLKSMPAKFIALDEVDEYPRDVEGQGDPISLVFARVRTFARRKLFEASTPTVSGASKIAEDFEISDQRYYFVPCPHCHEKQTLKFDNLKWTEGDPKSVLYYCEHCGVGIEERYKTKMLLAGEWRAQNPKSDIVGFFINALYSPLGWYSWKQIAADYEVARQKLEKEKDSTLLKAFTNTVLGETYEESGEVPEWRVLYHRRETYKQGTLPEKVLFLTAGVDVQKDRLEIEVVGWGRKRESWSIDYQVFGGDTSDEKVWNDLASYLGRTFPHVKGPELPIRVTCIDSGFNTQQVYNFTRRFSGNKVIPVKGNDTLSMIVGFPKAVDMRLKGKVYRRAVKVWNVGVSLLKSELYGFLRLPQPIGEEQTPPGFCHFPEYDEEYFRQLTAEKLVIKRNRKNFSVTEWVKDRERNEALDCRIYARAAASLVGVDRFKDHNYDQFEIQVVEKKSESMDNQSELPVNKESPTKEVQPRPPKPRRKRERSDFWGGYD